MRNASGTINFVKKRSEVFYEFWDRSDSRESRLARPSLSRDGRASQDIRDTLKVRYSSEMQKKIANALRKGQSKRSVIQANGYVQIDLK